MDYPSIQVVNFVAVPKKDSPVDKSSVNVDEKVKKNDEKINNKNWRKHREELDNLGIQVNSTVLRLIKKNSSESVEGAIAFLKIGKRDNYLENPTGYFVQALKEKWNSQSKCAANEQDKFRYWYSLAKELGQVTGSEIRDGEQWVCFTGTWEIYQNVVERGHTIEYLKKVIDRAKNR